jgi:hypothetical protein
MAFPFLNKFKTSWLWILFSLFCCLLCLVFFFFEKGSHYIAQAGLELGTLLPQPPECWDCKHVPHTQLWLGIFNSHTKSVQACEVARMLDNLPSKREDPSSNPILAPTTPRQNIHQLCGESSRLGPDTHHEADFVSGEVEVAIYPPAGLILLTCVPVPVPPSCFSVW